MPDDDRLVDDLEGRASDLTQRLAQRHFGTIRHIFDESIVHASQTAIVDSEAAWINSWMSAFFCRVLLRSSWLFVRFELSLPD